MNYSLIFSLNTVTLTLSPPIPLRLYTMPHWFNPPFLIFDIRALSRLGVSARASKIKNGAYGAEPFKQQQFETVGVKGVKRWTVQIYLQPRRLCYCPYTRQKRGRLRHYLQADQ